MPRTSAALIAAAALATTLLAAGEAAASKIVYSCAPELCAVDPDSGASSPVTSDGATSAYRYPSISRDGKRLAAARGGSDVMVGTYGSNLTERWAGTRDMNDVAIAPDGSAVGESHSYVENRYGCPLTGGCLQLVDRSATFYTRGFGEAATTSTHPGGGGVGFLGGALLSSRYTIADDMHQICVVADPAADPTPCEPRIVSPTTLTDPAGSPDGKLIAIAVGAPPPSEANAVVLYDAASGARVRELAADGSSPAFSPDGEQVAYAGADGWIHVVATGGGKARRLVEGHSPTWGDGDGPGPAVASKSLRYANGRVPVKLSCAGSVPCRGKLTLKKGRATLASRSYRVKAGKRATLAVRPTSRGRTVLAGATKHRVTVRLALAKGKSVTRKLTLRR